MPPSLLYQVNFCTWGGVGEAKGGEEKKDNYQPSPQFMSPMLLSNLTSHPYVTLA